MTLNFGNKKITSNQNLIPSSLIWKYLYQRTIIPILIAVVSIIVVGVSVFYIVPAITENVEAKTEVLTNQSLAQKNAKDQATLKNLEAKRDEKQNEYDNYYTNNPVEDSVNINDSILTELRSEIVRLQQELVNIENSKENMITDNKYHIEELFSHIDSIRGKDVTIVSIEDQNSENANSSLVYKNDVGDVAFSLHGLATDSRSLANFLIDINKCEYVKSSVVISVETHTVSEDQNIYVFEVSITPMLESAEE